jgi:hypothetical protein
MMSPKTNLLQRTQAAIRAYNTMATSEKGDPSSFLQRAFLLIGMARTSGSARASTFALGRRLLAWR